MCSLLIPIRTPSFHGLICISNIIYRASLHIVHLKYFIKFTIRNDKVSVQYIDGSTMGPKLKYKGPWSGMTYHKLDELHLIFDLNFARESSLVFWAYRLLLDVQVSFAKYFIFLFSQSNFFCPECILDCLSFSDSRDDGILQEGESDQFMWSDRLRLGARSRSSAC